MSWTTVHLPTKRVLWAGRWYPTWDKKWPTSTANKAHARAKNAVKTIDDLVMILESGVMGYHDYNREQWNKFQPIHRIKTDPDSVLQHGINLVAGQTQIQDLNWSNHPSIVWESAKRDHIKYWDLDTYLEMDKERFVAFGRSILTPKKMSLDYEDYEDLFPGGFVQVRPKYLIGAFLFFNDTSEALRFKLASGEPLKLGSLRKLQAEAIHKLKPLFPGFVSNSG